MATCTKESGCPVAGTARGIVPPPAGCGASGGDPMGKIGNGGCSGVFPRRMSEEPHCVQ
jgi:hypothetical protein